MSEGGRHERRRFRGNAAKLHKLLDEARRAPDSGTKGGENARNRGRSIAAGAQGANRMCEGKVRFARRSHAVKAMRDLAVRHGDSKVFEIYPCPFCAGFHFASPSGRRAD